MEDDAQTAAVVSKSLAAYHYQVDAVSDGQAGWDLMQTYTYDLLLLDVVLPRLDGIDLCRKLRAEGYKTPILLLTAKDDARDRVVGLEAGADDYVSKPFDLPELVARVRALLRRSDTIQLARLGWERLQLDQDSNEVSYGDKRLHLTPKEYGLLELFLRNPRRVFNRSTLLERLWSLDDCPGEEAVTTHIKGLRRKLKAAGMTADPIETVYGLGYRLKQAPGSTDQPADQTRPQPSSADSTSSTDSTDSTNSTDSAVADRSRSAASSAPASVHRQQAEANVMAIVAAMWEKFKTTMTDRIALLEQATTDLVKGTPDPELWQQAKVEAHRLIGALGSYGLIDGSQVARQIEALLQTDLPIAPDQVQQLEQLIATLKQIVAQKSSQPPPAMPAVPIASPPIARLLVIDDDTLLTDQLAMAAAGWGIEIDKAPNPAVAREKLAAHRPDVILLDLTFPNTPETGETGLMLLSELSKQVPTIPILVFTAHNQLSDRVKVAQSGGRGFLRKPISPEQIFDAVTRILNQTQTINTRVLIVDDDPHVLMQLQVSLQALGFQVITLDNPNLFWDVLETTQPDLLILDVEMPDLTGFELCRVVRNDCRWSQLPVLFLSAHTDAKTIHQGFAIGADDYVAKPIAEPELIVRVLNRLERAQCLRTAQQPNHYS